jgi:predicted cupin superfamily sugar epimerase
MDDDVRALIAHFDLQPLPVEGTLFTQSYRSPITAAGGGPAGTAIVGLLCADPRSFSCFHTLTFDEVWHVYGGDPFRLILLNGDGTSSEIVMGGDVLAGQRVQFTVPAGTWQAAELIAGGRYALYGCTMAPGFTSDAFVAATAAALIARWPQRASEIRRLSVADDVRMPDGL